jgi:small subunit ribosomal protein S21
VKDQVYQSGDRADNKRKHDDRRGAPGNTVVGKPLEVVVDERGIERALRVLKRKIALEGVLKATKRRRCYEKPSIRKRRKRREAERRRRRVARRMALRAGRH